MWVAILIWLVLILLWAYARPNWQSEWKHRIILWECEPYEWPKWVNKPYFKAVSLFSYIISEKWLSYLMRNAPIWRDPTDGWNIWLDASYARYVRNEKKNNPYGKADRAMP